MPVYHVRSEIDVLVDARDEDAAVEGFLDVFSRDHPSFVEEVDFGAVEIYEIDHLG